MLKIKLNWILNYFYHSLHPQNVLTAKTFLNPDSKIIHFSIQFSKLFLIVVIVSNMINNKYQVEYRLLMVIAKCLRWLQFQAIILSVQQVHTHLTQWCPLINKINICQLLTYIYIIINQNYHPLCKCSDNLKLEFLK